MLYCLVPSGVTIEAEAGMIVYGQCWGQISSTHCTAPLMCARFVFVWVMCCSWHHSDSACESVGRALAECLEYAAWQPVSSSLGLCAHVPWQSERPIACPRSRLGHSRFWCCGDKRGAHGLGPSVIWPPVIITVSGAVIPEHNGLSQFIEDTGKPSVLVWEFDLIACLQA